MAGQEVSLGRLEERIAQLRQGPLGRHIPPAGRGEASEVRRLIARQLVTEDILAIEAEAAAVDPSAPLSVVVPLLFERATSGVRVGEHDLREYYERNIDRYWRPEARHVRHVLVADRVTARWLVGRLRRGARLADLARRHSKDAASRHLGGDIGSIRRGELVGALEDALFAAPVRAIVGPIRSEAGWHVARVESVLPEGHMPFEHVRPAIAAELLDAARHQAFADWLEARRAKLALMVPEFAHPADPRHGAPTHRH